MTAKMNESLLPLVQQFVQDLEGLVERETMGMIEETLRERFGSRSEERTERPTLVRKTAHRICPFPGCEKPGKGPRFSFFCEEHRDLPKKDRDRIRLEARLAEAKGEGKVVPLKKRQKRTQPEATVNNG